jgi:hypothetical protein
MAGAAEFLPDLYIVQVNQLTVSFFHHAHIL